MRPFHILICYFGIATAQTGANCDVPCENYVSELLTVNNLYSTAVYQPGGLFRNPSGVINSMCSVTGSDIQTCFICSHDGQGLTGTSDLQLLDAWWQTCVNYQQKGVDSAYACWQSIPAGSGECLYLASDPNHPQHQGTTTNGGATLRMSWSDSVAIMFLGLVVYPLL